MCLPFWMKTCAGEPTSNEAAGVSDVPKADARQRPVRVESGHQDAHEESGSGGAMCPQPTTPILRRVRVR